MSADNRTTPASAQPVAPPTGAAAGAERDNDDIVRQLFADTLHVHDKTSSINTTDEEYHDAQTSPPAATTTNTDTSAASDSADDGEDDQPTTEPDVDEDSRRDWELALSAEELAANERKAAEIKDFGNLQFKNEEYAYSLQSYTEALDICPLASTDVRAVLLGNRAAAKLQLADNAGALEDCSRSLKLKPDYMKVLLRRAKLYEDTDKLDESLEDYKKALELHSDCAEARSALVRLPPKIDERNEKLKTEMLGKLKDLGNMILRPFGLSTNNFQMTQDPATGSYSVNFNQGNQNQ